MNAAKSADAGADLEFPTLSLQQSFNNFETAVLHPNSICPPSEHGRLDDGRTTAHKRVVYDVASSVNASIAALVNREEKRAGYL